MLETERGLEGRLQDLYTPSPWIYWTDLVLSAGLGWALFAVAVMARDPFVAVPAIVLSTLLVYRAQAFLHELSHAGRLLAGFPAAWNLLVGFPLLMPYIFAVGVHRVHHNPAHYGSVRDPEYLAFGHSRALIVAFAAKCLLLGPLMVLRWLVVAPVALLLPPLQRVVDRRVTSMALNPAFVRQVSAVEHRHIVQQQLGVILFWAPLLALVALGVWPVRVLAAWLVLATGIWVLTTVRTLVAHRYDSTGQALDRQAQVMDSVDTPGRWWTEIWAPVGHRHHALHHLLPAIPYHHHTEAYRRLMRDGAPQAALAVAANRSLPAALHRLWVQAGTTTAGASD